MSDQHSLYSNRRVDVGSIEAVFRTTVDEHSAYYVSTPITSGERFVQWRSATSLTEVDPRYADEHRRQVVDANRVQVRPFVKELRRSLAFQ